MKRKFFFVALALLLGGVLYVLRVPLARWVLAQHAQESGSASAPQAENSTAHAGEKILYWVDPMHPAYKSDKPGIAPDCGMQLVPVYAAEAEALAKMPPGTVRLLADRQQTIGIQMAQAEFRSLNKKIQAVARITYDETRIHHVHSKVDGWIEKVFVDFTGAPVRHGQPLFTFYSPELLATQEEFLIAVRARKDLATSPAREAAEGAQRLYEAARRRLQLWDLTEEQIRQVEETGQAQKSITFYSPHDGFVLERKAYAHQRVTPDMDIYSIADLSRVWAIADIYEYEAPLIREGLGVRVLLPYAPQQALFGRVSYIYPQLDAQARTLRVRIDLPNPGLKLRAEMFLNAEIEIPLGRHLTVPKDAVLDSGTKQYVFVSLGNGYFAPREVQAGVRSEDSVAIAAGLRRGESVVAAANFLLDSERQLKAAVGQMSGHLHPK